RPAREAGRMTINTTTLTQATAPMRRPRVLRLPRSPKVIVGLVIMGIFAVIAVIGRWITPYSPNATDTQNWVQHVIVPGTGPGTDFPATYYPLPYPPSAEHWLGTTVFAQDVFSQLLASTQATLVVGLLSAVIATVLSILFGVTAGYIGRRIVSRHDPLCDLRLYRDLLPWAGGLSHRVTAGPVELGRDVARGLRQQRGARRLVVVVGAARRLRRAAGHRACPGELRHRRVHKPAPAHGGPLPPRGQEGRHRGARTSGANTCGESDHAHFPSPLAGEGDRGRGAPPAGWGRTSHQCQRCRPRDQPPLGRIRLWRPGGPGGHGLRSGAPSRQGAWTRGRERQRQDHPRPGGDSPPARPGRHHRRQ